MTESKFERGQPQSTSQRTSAPVVPGATDGVATTTTTTLCRLGSVVPWTIWVAPLVLPMLAGSVAMFGLLIGLWAYGQPYSSDDAVWRVSLVLGATIGIASIGGTLFLLALNGYFMRIALSRRLTEGGHRYRTPRSRKLEREQLRLRYTPGILELVTHDGEMRAACVCMLEFAYDPKRSLDDRFAALLEASRKLELVLEVRVPAADPNAEVCHDYDPRRSMWVPGTEHE